MKEEPLTRQERDLLIRLDESVKRIEETLNNFIQKVSESYVRRSEHSDLETRVGKIEGYFSWTIKIVLGAVILAVLGLIIRNVS